MLPELTLRAATDADAEAIAALWTEVYVKGGLIPFKAPFTVERVVRAKTGGELMVAQRDGALIGAVSLVARGAPLANLIEQDDERQICLLAVDAAARRCGAGRALMDWCIARSRSHAARSVLLWSRPTQSAAHQLYEQLGFQRWPQRDSAPGGHPQLVYRLAL